METRTAALLAIGRFSRLSGLSAKALRHYDSIGLLRPARVDADTGYRLYAPEQLREAGAIARLRALEVPLDECKAILEAEQATVRERLKAHRARLERRADELQGQLALLDGLLAGRESLTEASGLEKIELRAFPEQPTLTMRSRIHEEDLDRTIGRSINGVAAYLRELGEEAAGPPFSIRPDVDEDDVAEVEIGWPTRLPVAGRGRIESRSLPTGQAAWAVYRGPYEGLPGAYRAVYEWIVVNSRVPSGDAREIYYTDPDETPDPAEYVTGLVWPVR